MQKKKLYSWLLPTEKPEPITRHYDSALRRPLLHQSKQGDEQTIQQCRRLNPVERERRRNASYPIMMYHA